MSTSAATATALKEAHPSGHKPIKFGTDGWRAIIADGFTYHNVGKVVTGIGRYMKQTYDQDRPVVIGFDTRFMADTFAAYAAYLLQEMGFTIRLTEQYTATPVVAFSARHLNSTGALMFTASHNPPEYCGIKYIPPYAGPATPDITNALLAEIQREDVPAFTPYNYDLPLDGLSRFNPYPDYWASIASQIDFEALKKRPVKILHDPMYGAGQGLFNTILKEKAGWGVEAIHSVRDPLFGGQIPEPKDDYLETLMHRVKTEDFELGIANDGDADRVGIIGEDGRFYGTNQLMPMLMRYLYHHKGFRGNVVRTVATSRVMDCLATKFGDVEVRETPVGFKYVGEWMRKEAIIVGGEESGGVSIWNHIPEKDGLIAGLLIAEMIAVENKPLSQIWKDTQAESGHELFQEDCNFHISEAAKMAVVDALKQLEPGQAFGDFTITDINRLDGTKLFFGEWDWVLMRPSGTEPVLRFYGESESATRMHQYAEAVNQYVHRFDQ